MKKLLEKLVKITYQRCVDDGYDPLMIENLSHRYLNDYQEKRYVALTCREALEQPDYLWVRFFSNLYNFVGGEVRPLSPVSNRTDSSWMFEYDYCFVNPRATSLDPAKTGTFLQATKLMPILRCKGIHLAPFFDCTFANVYCIDSLRMVNPATLDGRLLKEGIGPDEQVRFFIDMAHLCGMVVGFDLEPHTSQFSRVVLEHPDKFRWIRLNKQKTDTKPAGMEAVLNDKVQQKIIKRVRDIVQKSLKTQDLKAVEPVDTDGTVLADKSDRIRDAHSAAVKKLIKHGLWTIPSHTWNGVGLPRFKRYNRAEDFPEFEYLDVAGEDQSEHAFGMVTPFRFYDGLPVNKTPTQGSAPSLNQDVIDFFAGIVPEIQRRYGFDFVRFDYVDHVFDSVIEVKEGQDMPIADRYTPSVLQTIISHGRDSKPYLGAMAERMGSEEKDKRRDMDNYGSIGFNLLIGDIWMGPIDVDAINRLSELSRPSLSDIGPEQPCRVMWAVDTHDSGYPLFWSKPLSQVVGSEGMLLRQFLARFGTVGPLVRPKYECMGNQT